MAGSKDYGVTVHSSNEFAEGGPSFANFTIDEEMAREIVRLSAVVRDNCLLDCRRFDYTPTWLMSDPNDLDEGEENEEVRTECDCLIVSDHDFGFMCYQKHGDTRYDTEHQSISELAEHFGIPWTHPNKLLAVNT